MLTIWTSDTYFTAEPIGDQLSSLKQESQDTTTIVQTKVCIQSKFVAKIPGQKKPFPSWKCFVQEPLWEEGLDGQSPVSPSRSPVRNLPPVHLGGGLDPQTRCTQEYENTESEVLKKLNQLVEPQTRCTQEYENTESEALISWTNLCSYLDCHNFGRSSHQRPTNALFAGRQNKAKLRVASYLI